MLIMTLFYSEFSNFCSVGLCTQNTAGIHNMRVCVCPRPMCYKKPSNQSCEMKLE